ncbi:class I SAM-dependent methyltransferase [Lentzea aerocolonigenes]|uniref:class I SAM-dependent methyltransferase n=1 Tax=Lentzea aerocolonigenes TaxID=68170 RepID=UPI000A71E6D3|nr:class I SAM-dependent methyltransferase [Lentzea aerocolonigenes]
MTSFEMAADAGTEALREHDLTDLAAHMRRLDETALLGITRALSADRALVAGEPRSAEEVMRALGVVPRHHWIVRRWLRVLVEEGRLTGDGRYRGLVVAGEAEFAASRAALDDARRALGYPPELTRFFLQSIDCLPLLVRDEVSVQNIMFPDGDFATALGTYSHNIISTYTNRVAAVLVRQIARAGARRVLEVGAGIGGTTAGVVEELERAGLSGVDYEFTDLSRFFLVPAAERFADRPWMRFGLFDVNAEPDRPEQSVDLIIAANVLHNAHDVDVVLARLRGLLAHGGHLVIIESCREHYQVMTSMQFLMSGRVGEARQDFTDFRAGTDRIFLTEHEWVERLTAGGFRVGPVLPGAGSPLAPLAQHVFTACV